MYHQQERDGRNLNIQFSEANLISFLSLGRSLSNQSHVRAIASLIAILINLPQPFNNEESINLESIAAKELHLKADDNLLDKTYEMIILSILLPHNPEAI